MPDTPAAASAKPGPLAGLRVFDLTRILAGPTCTQLLGDLGADVIKIERPGEGDDTRKWGPPFLRHSDGQGDDTAAYYLSSNRNKRSLTIDISTPEGQALAKRVAATCDIFVENFKVGGLKKFGLDYASIKQVKPDIVYCSITGFGQTGPYAPRAGYDYLAQGLGGIMSLTGAADGEPAKVGVGIADIMCGMYATTAILAALRHRDRTGEGQAVDVALLDTQVAWLTNEGCNYLLSGKVPVRQGSEHPNIVPYRIMPSADGHFILAVGNDAQFKRFCEFGGAPELVADPRFTLNRGRVENRTALYPLLFEVTKRKTSAEWLAGLEALGVPAGAVNDLKGVFEDPQVLARDMKIKVDYPDSPEGAIDLIGNPIKLSGTPVVYRRPPPRMGQHSDEVLREAGLSDDEIELLRQHRTI